MQIFDGHSDLLFDAVRKHAAGEERSLERYHLPRLRQGGIEGLVLAVWTSPISHEPFWDTVPGGRSVVRQTELLFAAARRELTADSGIVQVRTAAEAETVRKQGKLYAFLGVEGMAAIGGDPAGIDRYAEAGVRLGMLTWNEENALAAGAGGDPAKRLTAAGRQVIRRMQAHRMLVDVSHLNDGGFKDVISMADGPVLASHSNCRALCDVRRNLTDDQLRAIRDTGGVVGLNVCRSFVHAEPEKQTAEMLAIHAAHMAEVMGPEYVACGFDFCEFMGPGNDGADGLEDASRAGDFLHCLERVGFSRAELEGIAMKNLLRLF